MGGAFATEVTAAVTGLREATAVRILTEMATASVLAQANCFGPNLVVRSPMDQLFSLSVNDRVRVYL